jgi:hypothetical protein
MSYLDVPRLHFSGLFFTGPSTINNTLSNYDPTTQLESPPGQYVNPPAGWNPLGVAQWWLEECTVLSAVGSTGSAVPSSDSVIGANVQSPSPKTPMPDGLGGYYDIAKMVDLDVDMQIRSALYGVRIAVRLPNQVTPAGFEGRLTVPELRQLNRRIIVSGTGSWAFVGNWMGTLTELKWSGDISSSPFLQSLKNGNYGGLNVKLTVDLHRNQPQNLFTTGDQFCYGRVLGSIGPAFPTELPQVVPGRCLQKGAASAPAPAALMTSSALPKIGTRDRLAAEIDAVAEEASVADKASALTAAPPDPWNPACAIIRQVGNQTLLSIDIGGCILLNHQPGNPPTSDGTFVVDSGIVVGVVNKTTGTFTPFQNGNISIAPQYQPLQSTAKNTTLVKNSCVFSFPITSADGTSYQSNPLAIRVSGTTVAQEYLNGYWIDMSVSSQRLECALGQTAQSAIMVRKYGTPVTGPPPVTAQIQLDDGGSTSDVAVAFGNLNADGIATVTTKIFVDQLQLPPDRVFLDSLVYFVLMKDSSGQLIGDEAAEGYSLSLLVFQAYTAPANPTWNDVAQIFNAYARMYPGMKSRFDISDPATVKGDPQAVLDHMAVPVEDPMYMPVTRDLSPAKVQMIVKWLKTQIGS